MRIQEFCINLLLACAGLLFIFVIIPQWTEPGFDDVGLMAETLPSMCCWVIVGLSVLQIIEGLRLGLKKSDGKEISLEILVHMIKFFVPMFMIIPLWTYLGFFPGSIIVLATLLLVSGQRSAKVLLPICLLVPGVVYCLLWYGLNVPTP